MKFDVCIMNPPYDRNLHLQILSKVIKHCDKTVNISPIRWLQDPLAKYKKNSDYNKYKVSICDKMTNLEMLDSLQANSLFKQAFNMNIAITTYNVKSNKRFDYVKFNTIDLLDKLISKSTDFIANHTKTSIMRNWTIVLSLMIGGSNGRTGKQKYWNDDYDRTVYHDNVRADGKTYKEYRQSVCWGNVKPKESAHHIEFNTELEVKNFYNYLHTKVFTYIFKVTQIDINPHSDFYPFMNDYTRQWTDKDLCEFFNITGYINDNTAEPGSEWETIIDCVKNN